jgi:cyanate permease
MVPAVFYFVIDRPSDRNTGPDGENSPAAVETVQAAPHLAKTDMLRNLNFWLIAFAIGLPMSAASAVVSNLMPFALDIGIAPGRAALVLSTFAVGSLFGPMAFAALGDRVDLRVLFAASALFNVLALLGFAYASSAEIVFGASALFAFGGALLTPLWGMLVARVFGQEHIGSVMGAMSVIVAVLCVFSPALFGAVRDQTGSYTAAFLLYAALIGLTILLISRVRTDGRPAVAAVPAAT